MSYTLFSEKTVKAKKNHRCIWCGQSIEAGSKYVRESSIYYGDFQNFAWHDECRAYAMDNYFNEGEEEFLGFSQERPTLEMAYKADPTECDITM